MTKFLIFDSEPDSFVVEKASRLVSPEDRPLTEPLHLTLLVSRTSQQIVEEFPHHFAAPHFDLKSPDTIHNWTLDENSGRGRTGAWWLLLLHFAPRGLGVLLGLVRPPGVAFLGFLFALSIFNVNF